MSQRGFFCFNNSTRLWKEQLTRGLEPRSVVVVPGVPEPAFLLLPLAALSLQRGALLRYRRSSGMQIIGV